MLSFFPVAFNILSLSLIFIILITMCLSVFLLGFICLGHRASWTWWIIFFPMLGKSSANISLNIFSGPFFSFCGPCNVNIGASNVAQEVF